MPLERHESHRMRGAEARLHTPPSRGANSLPGPHLCCPRIKFNSVQSLSHVQLFVTPWTAIHQAFLSITNSQSLLKLISIESMMPSNHLILCHHLLLMPSVFATASGSFLMSQPFASGGQNFGAAASASVLSMNIQG